MQKLNALLQIARIQFSRCSVIFFNDIISLCKGENNKSEGEKK